MSGLQSRRTFIYLALSSMAAAWITGLLHAFFPNAGPWPPVTLLVLTLLTLIPLGLSRGLRKLELRQDLRRGVLAGVFVFLALLLVSAGFYNSYGVLGVGWMDRLLQNELSSGTFLNQSSTLMLVALCWWIGLTLGDMRLTHTNLQRYFYSCILALILPAVFFVSDVSRDLPWLYFLFLFTGMLMLGLGRVEEAARHSQDRGSSRGSPFTLYWLSHLGSNAGLLLVLIALLQISGLVYGFSIILVLVAPIIYFLAYPLIFVGVKVIAIGLEQSARQQEQVLEAPSLGVSGAEVSQAYSSNTLQHFCAGLVVLIVCLVFVLGIIYATRSWRKLLKDNEREGDAALPSLGNRVSEVVEERLERLRINLPGLSRLRKRLAARSIRRIYAALTALGAERGYPRSAAVTPYEHLWSLRQAFRGCELQVEQITEAYVAAHYGQVPETRKALQKIKTAWEHVRVTARRQ